MTTRAIRRFTDDPVSDEEIAICLQAAQQAPSGGNVQPQQYVVVTDPEQKAAVAALYRSSFDRYEKSLPDPSSFRDEAARESWARTRDASRHLADHVQDAPAIVFFLQPIIPWAPPTTTDRWTSAVSTPACTRRCRTSASRLAHSGSARR